ncbi:hypothetical protein JTB14_028534 [Gonioctena quinquepunctata]|nr:hypothetical protein JTB14_028534 [Gonioctena quinquepunctata]
MKPKQMFLGEASVGGMLRSDMYSQQAEDFVREGLEQLFVNSGASYFVEWDTSTPLPLIQLILRSHNLIFQAEHTLNNLRNQGPMLTNLWTYALNNEIQPSAIEDDRTIKTDGLPEPGPSNQLNDHSSRPNNSELPALRAIQTEANQLLSADTSDPSPKSPQPGPSGLQATSTQLIAFSPKDIRPLPRAGPRSETKKSIKNVKLRYSQIPLKKMQSRRHITKEIKPRKQYSNPIQEKAREHF